MITAFINGLFWTDWCQAHPVTVELVVAALAAMWKAAWDGFNSEA
jgi:hypothetical protein